MATILSHALVAGTACKLSPFKNRNVLRICLIGSILPDLDVLGFKYGVAYAHPMGHRGFSHSILFAVLYALIFALFFWKHPLKTKLGLFLLFFFSIMSHGLLDMLTNGGLGVGLFIPWDEGRYFLPTRPLEVSPIGKYFFSSRGLDVIINEFLYIGLPCLTLLAGNFLLRRVKVIRSSNK